jgi:hypothetical protein|tara:strand:- start:121 stop:582 length:462 start_codon:yes stop_codon:yes gene_type:complete
MKDNFDVHKWNLNRYKETINEIDIDDYTDKNVNSDEENSSFNITRGGDDAKMGAEEESDANVVGEGLSDRISKIDIGYTEQGRLYGVKIEDASGKRLGKLAQDDANGLLKMLNINDELPFKMSFGDEDILDSIVNQLQDQGIDASWDDVMDVS